MKTNISDVHIQMGKVWEVHDDDTLGQFARHVNCEVLQLLTKDHTSEHTFENMEALCVAPYNLCCHNVLEILV